MMNNYASLHLSDIGRANPIVYVQQNVVVPSQWTYGQATKSLVCFNSKNKPWSIRVRSDYSIDVDMAMAGQSVIDLRTAKMQ